MAQGHGLGLLQVGKTRHDGVLVLLHFFENNMKKRQEFGPHLFHLAPGKQAHVDSHLVVSAAAGMESLPGLSDPLGKLCLDEGMNVFVPAPNFKLPGPDVLPDGKEAFVNGLPVLLGNNALFGEHLSMG